MLEQKIDIWEIHAGNQTLKDNSWVCITTNGIVKTNGEAVMGRGCALQCAQKFPDFPARLGNSLNKVGNTLMCWGSMRIITFPVKHHWKDPGDLKLIDKSCFRLKEWMDAILPKCGIVYLPRPGCGNGQLDYESEVKPILLKHFKNDDRLVVVTNEGDDDDVPAAVRRGPGQPEPTNQCEARVRRDK